MMLTPHFCLEELVRSETAIRRGIPNEPSEEVIRNLRHLCTEVLEPLRCHFGQPVVISSGYRCPPLNRAVGGSPHSQHLKGEAADIRVPDPTTGNQWFSWMERHLPFDQLIQERATRTSPTFWIHVSCCRDRPNRRQVIRQLIKNPP